MSSDTAVTRTTDPHLLAADLIDMGRDRYVARAQWFFQLGGLGLLPLIYYAPVWLWLAVPLLIVTASAFYLYQIWLWWRWASAHDIDPEFLRGAAREAEFVHLERMFKSPAHSTVRVNHQITPE